MPLPSVNLPRLNGQLPLTIPTEDAVVALIVGNDGATQDAYTCLQFFSYTQASAAFAEYPGNEDDPIMAEIKAFYDIMGDGAELNVMTVPNDESLSTICDLQNANGVKRLLNYLEGRCVIVGIQPTFRDNPSAAKLGGLDASIRQGVDKLNSLAASFDNKSMPFVAVVPGYGFSANNLSALPARTALTSNDYVAISLACDTNNGVVSIGKLLGNIAKKQVHQNVARVADGKVSDTAFFPDGTPVKQLQDSLGAIHDKGYIIYRQFTGKSGYYYNDDPTATIPTSDFSSISWNRVINKAKRLAYTVLIEKLNDTVELNESTGQVETTILSDWESDVETAIRNSMIKVAPTKSKEISGIKCTVDSNSDIVNNNITGSLQIVRNGQAKNISFSIAYTTNI
jgi:Protein of unknown function (DUF2586)